MVILLDFLTFYAGYSLIGKCYWCVVM